jgi:hypothetical protein
MASSVGTAVGSGIAGSAVGAGAAGSSVGAGVAAGAHAAKSKVVATSTKVNVRKTFIFSPLCDWVEIVWSINKDSYF